MKHIYITGSKRTAIGGFMGGFAEVSAPELGSAVAAASIAQADIPGDEVDEVIFGNVLSAGLGQNVARQVAIGAGLDTSVGATTINKVCGSGLKSVMLAAQAIQCGDADLILAGGAENMSRAPYLLENARTGYRLGSGELVDSMIRDGLWDAYNDLHMGTCGDRCAERYDFSREDQDDFAISSYKRALRADSEGQFSGEIVPVKASSGKTITTIDRDEEPLRFDEDKLRQLRPAFSKDGTVTPGNASSINDGAASVIVLSGDKAEGCDIAPEVEILGYATHAQEPEWFTLAPIGAISKLLSKLSLKVSDIDLFEINEAFSGVPMAAAHDLDIPAEKLNVNGGAVALGHPIGASGTRILVTLIHALKCADKHIGIAALCIGGGEAVALAVRRI
jgi:acetyl-CoA C-acetyltransferase